MAIFAVNEKEDKRRMTGLKKVCHKIHLTERKLFSKSRLRRSLGAVAGTMTLWLGLAQVAPAQTTGSEGVVSGNVILSEMIGRRALFPLTGTGTDPIDLDDALFSFIKNPYIGVVLGVEGSYTVQYSDNFSAAHNIPGMLSFGNQIGSVRSASDDREGLCGDSRWELFSGDPLGYGTWPLASHWEEGTGFIANDFSAYTRLTLDGTIIPILGDGTDSPSQPLFTNGVLRAVYDIGSNVEIAQEIRLFRGMAQIRWIITNRDTAAHTVGLRFTVLNRANRFELPPDLAAIFPDANNRLGYFFENPVTGLDDRIQLLQPGQIPDVFSIYGKRYEPENAADPPFAAKHIFRGFGATPPSAVLLGHPFELRPEADGYNYVRGQLPFVRDRLTAGIATAVYFGPVTVLGGGGQSTIITYYGNGATTDRIQENFVVSAEGVETLSYNASTATAPEVTAPGAVDPNTIIPRFLIPNPIEIVGGLYNRIPSGPQTAINFNNVRGSLTLPPGLAFATVPGTTQTDVAEKLANGTGLVASDTGADVNWYVQPTADAFGTLSYVVNFSTNEFGSQQVTRAINIPATPFRTVTAEAFQMIGFPFEFDLELSNNADPTTVVNGRSTPVDEPVLFYRYVPDPQNPNGFGRYEVVNQLQNGIGYMYRPNINRTIYARGVRPLPNQARPGFVDFAQTAQSQRQLTLERGWNIISNPYLFDISLQSLRFAQEENNPSGTSQNFQQAVRSGLIRGGVFFRNPETNSYDFLESATEPLQPWEGYWIYLNNRSTIVFSLPTQHNGAVLPQEPVDQPATRKRTRGMIASGKALIEKPKVSDWRLQLVATRSEKITDRATIIGVTNESNVNSNALTLPKPPPLVNDYVYVGIVNANKGRNAKDIRKGQGKQEWEIEVTADKEGPVTLTWPNMAKLPRRVNLTLKDVSTGRTYAMRSNSSVTVNTTPAKPSRFVVTAKTAASQPLAVSNLRVVSNGTRSEGRSFVFNLNREATISGQIKTIRGKTMATLATGRSATNGENRLNWNGRAQNGSPLPPGPYMIEIIAQGDEGETVPTSRVFMTVE